MTNLAHIVETASLLLAAYLLGCALGYGVRLILHAGRGTRQVAPPADVVAAARPEQRKPRSSAARLAASVEALPSAPNATPIPTPAAPPALQVNPVERAKIVPAQFPAAKAGPVSARSVGTKPTTLVQPHNGGPDNLKQIKGIGPKIEASLQALGIFHLEQIASWNKANVEWVEAQLSFKGRVRRERWVEQAQQLTPSTRALSADRA